MRARGLRPSYQTLAVRRRPATAEVAGALGIEKGKPFNPDARMQGILVKAAQIANDQMRVQSFADRRPDRIDDHRSG